jgi:hypothetical protein
VINSRTSCLASMTNDGRTLRAVIERSLTQDLNYQSYSPTTTRSWRGTNSGKDYTSKETWVKLLKLLPHIWCEFIASGVILTGTGMQSSVSSS